MHRTTMIDVSKNGFIILRMSACSLNTVSRLDDGMDRYNESFEGVTFKLEPGECRCDEDDNE